MSAQLLLLQQYADLLIKFGVNLQPGQALRIDAELAQRDFVAQLSAVAYQAGARYVQVDWIDTPSDRTRYLYSQPAYLDFFPEYEIQRQQQMVAEGWARLALVGAEFPDIFDDVDPGVMRRVAQLRAQKLKFSTQAYMANQIQWCVAAAPTQAWAKKVFPALSAEQAEASLWTTILNLCRADQPDPIAAWQQHDRTLRQVTEFMQQQQVRAVHFLDSALGADGQPATNLTVALTDQPVWVAASSVTPAGVRFLPNLPTEEVFTTPHNQRTEGWVRTSKPAFPFERKVEDAWFRFVQGEVVDFRANLGQEIMEQFFQIPGSKRLGEISLVDVRSPVNQSNLLFYETLFDENAVCHLAFGHAYPDGLANGSTLTEAELAAQGVNQADTHVDFMIGTATMQVEGLCADGHTVAIMRDGQFVPEIYVR
jgi:aminopeptidase